MTYQIISFAHQNVSIELREQLNFSESEQVKLLKLAQESKLIGEMVILSTCNRTEIITYNIDETQGTAFILDLIQNIKSSSQFDKQQLESVMKVFKNDLAVKHLFKVASSLESIVIGESQILNQVKQAFKLAKKHKMTKQYLHKLFDFTMRCAARVKSHTDIAKNTVSVASEAVNKAGTVVKLAGQTALVIGSGTIAQLTVKYLLKKKSKIIVLARDVSKAQALMHDIDQSIKVISLFELKQYINLYPLLFAATSASTALITDELINHQDFNRFWFDLAVPRNIKMSNQANISLFTIDDLKSDIDRNLQARQKEALKALQIIEDFSIMFFEHIELLNINPVIKSLRDQAKNISSSVRAEAVKKGYISKLESEKMSFLIHQAFKKFLHHPTITLKNQDNESIQKLKNHLELLFQIKQK